MVTAKDVQGVMAMMPSFSTEDAGDLSSKNTVDVDNLKIGRLNGSYLHYDCLAR